ncbi:MAG: hypothetical protein ABR905_18015 [Terracidiphilus sp.]
MNRKQAYDVCMRRLAAVALMAAVVALPVCAQRATGHASLSSHSSTTPRGGFHSSAPRGFSAPISRGFASPGARPQSLSPRFATNSSVAIARTSRTSGLGNAGSGNRGHDGHHRRPYISPYGAGVLYGPGYGVIDPYPFGYPDTGGTDVSAAAPDQTNAGGYDAQPEVPWQPPTEGQPPAAVSNPPLAPESEEAVTIVFKDGRPAEQIHNYILTRSTLFVGDGQRREIPTDQLDLAATAKANRDAGVDFQLPVIAQ